MVPDDLVEFTHVGIECVGFLFVYANEEKQTDYQTRPSREKGIGPSKGSQRD